MTVLSIVFFAFAHYGALTVPAVVQDTVFIAGEQATGIATPLIPAQYAVVFLVGPGRTFVVDGTGDGARYLRRFHRGERVTLRYSVERGTYHFISATERP